MAEASGVWETLCAIRERAPLVQGFVDPLAADFTSNLLLAAGAVPMMAAVQPNLSDLMAHGQALLVGLAIPSEETAEALVETVRGAVDTARPWVLDLSCCATAVPWGAVAARLSHLQPGVICGSGTEIVSLSEPTMDNYPDPSRPIESAAALDAAQEVAQRTGAIVTITGAVDYVTDGDTVRAIANGHKLLTKIAGMGSAIAALNAAACTACRDPFAASSHASALIGLSAQRAAVKAKGPGAFRAALLDQLYRLDEEKLLAGVRMQ